MADPREAWNSLSPQTAQVLICDLQDQIVARSKTTDPNALRQSAGVLLKLAKLFELPTTLSVVPEQEKAPELIPELKDEDDFAVERLRSSASPFLDVATVDTLKANDRPILLLAGFAIEVVVLHAAIDAVRHGYEVLVLVDACGGMSASTEQAAFRQIESAGAATSSVVSVGTKLAPDFTTERGKRMFSIVQTLRLA